MTRRPALTLALLAAWTLSPARATTPTEHVPGRGALVIVGGALSSKNEAVYGKILELRLEGRPICVIPLASGEPRSSAMAIVADFARYGGEGAAIPIAFTSREPQRANDPELAKSLSTCGGFFFTGGDQSRIVDTLRPGGAHTAVYDVMLDVLRKGGVIAGSSAGAAMMSDPMIGGGDSGPALAKGVVKTEPEPGVWVRNGMGFLSGALTDQHFLARGRLGRTIAVLNARPDVPIAFGIDENTALLVRADHAASLGASGIVLVDMRTARRPSPGAGFTGARLYVLGEGDRFLFESGEVIPSADKVPLTSAQGAAAPEVPRDPWIEDAFARFVGNFAGFPARGASFFSDPYEIRLAKADTFRALARAGTAAHGMPRDLHAGPFDLDLVSVPAGAPSAPSSPKTRR